MKKNKNDAHETKLKNEQPEALQEASRPAVMPLWIKMILVVIASYHVVMLGYVAHNRLTNTAIIDESEDIHARCAQTIAEGEFLYGSESITWQRKDYTPFSFWVQSKAINYLGYDIRYQRAVSLLFGLGTILLVGASVKRLTGSFFWAYIASALLSGMDAGLWYMEVGPQPFHIFFAMLGLYLLIRDPACSIKTVVWSGLAFFLCYFSKQTGLAYLAVYIFYSFVKGRKKGLVALGISALLVLGTTFYFITRPDSDYLRLVLLWNALDPLIWSRLWSPILFPEMAGRFGVLSAIVIGTILMFNKDNWKQVLEPQFLLMLGGLGAGNFASMKYGSGNVQVIVGYASLILVGVVLLHTYMSRKIIPVGVTAGLLAVASLSLVHPVTDHVITREDQFRYDRVINIIRESPGKVKMFMIGYYNVIAGKEAFTDPFIDSVKREKEGVLQYRPYWTEYLKTIPWDTIITAVPMEYNTSLLQPMLQQHYNVREELPDTGRSGGIIRRRLIVLDKVTDQGPRK